MAELIRQRLPNSDVSTGQMAVTIKYSDDIEVQVLPAIRTPSGIRVPDPRSDGWSNVTHPDRFAQKLTDVNRANDGSVVPAVKLIKSMINSSIQSENSRLTGYHIDSLAIEAFKSYTGSTDLESMLDRFLTFAPAAVQTPIRDPSGQSRYVDEYLGGANSPERQRVANALTRLKRNFNACESELDLDDMFYTP